MTNVECSAVEYRPAAACRRSRYRRTQTGRTCGTADLCGGDRLVAFPDLVCLAAALSAGLRHFRRYRGARVPPEFCAVPGIRGLSRLRLVATRSGATGRLAAGRRRHLRGAV